MSVLAFEESSSQGPCLNQAEGATHIKTCDPLTHAKACDTNTHAKAYDPDTQRSDLSSRMLDLG